eukprot:1917476-Pleurochrysis_carterae.AAC.1
MGQKVSLLMNLKSSCRLGVVIQVRGSSRRKAALSRQHGSDPNTGDTVEPPEKAKMHGKARGHKFCGAGWRCTRKYSTGMRRKTDWRGRQTGRA